MVMQMTVMNKKLQIHVIRNILAKNGIDPSTIDLEALVDSNLSLPENIKNVSEHLGVALGMGIEDLHYFDGAIVEVDDDGNVEVKAMYNESDGVVQTYEVEEEMEGTEGSTEDLTEKDIEQDLSKVFEKVLKETDPLEYFSKYLFPEIVGEQYDYVRKAVLLMLATQFDSHKRNRIHVLLVGEPGCGKTEILLWVAQKFYGRFANAEHTSKVGLSGDARGKEITPGLLAESHGCILCIDELDKMSQTDQSALLQAMEEGRYTIVKGMHRETFYAEVRVLASANDISKISKPLLDRFDFVIHLKNPDKDERVHILDKLIDEFFGFFEPPKYKVLLEYLSWINDFEPQTTSEDLERIKDVLKSYINLNHVDVKGKSIRSFELSILRIAKAIAKLRRENLKAIHVVEAIKLKDPMITDEQVKYLKAVAQGII